MKREQNRPKEHSFYDSPFIPSIFLIFTRGSVFLPRPLNCSYFSALGQLIQLSTVKNSDYFTIKQLLNEFKYSKNNFSMAFKTI